MIWQAHANIENYNQDLAKSAFHTRCKRKYGNHIYRLKNRKRKPAYFTDALWEDYTKAWNTAASIKVSERCSKNRKQGYEKAPGTHCNGSVSFDVTVEKMVDITFCSLTCSFFNYH